MKTRYIWQRPTWPDLQWDDQALLGPLGEVRYAQGKLYGTLGSLGFEDSRQEIEVESLVEEAVTTSAIEGEQLPRPAVRSSVARRLGLSTAGLPAPSRSVEGVVEVLVDATSNFDKPLTMKRLKGWQAALFPGGYSGINRIRVGQWRKGPMQVISGPLGKERVHFEAPPAHEVNDEIKRFLRWWKTSHGQMHGIIRAGVAHLRFETIHAFEDGNGRVGRALADMALAQAEEQPRRFYSLSAQIHGERDEYYRNLEQAQKGDGEVTGWLIWFLGCLERSLERSQLQVQRALVRTRFWQHLAGQSLNPRQVKAVDRLLEAGPGGFEGGLTNVKYRRMTKTSKVTATRDLADLAQREILVREGEGRATRYDVNWKLGD